VTVWQLLITLRIRIATSIGTRLFLAQWKNAWKTAVKYALPHGGETSVLTPAVQHCPEPRNAEEHDLQDEEDKSYVRGCVAYVVP
jgi:hypothetical protein